MKVDLQSIKNVDRSPRGSFSDSWLSVVVFYDMFRGKLLHVAGKGSENKNITGDGDLLQRKLFVVDVQHFIHSKKFTDYSFYSFR